MQGMISVMKTAVPVHANRISPLFDTSTTLLEVMIQDGEEKGRRLLDITGQPAVARPKYLHTTGINVLICGAISSSLHMQIEFMDIEVIPCVAGEADEVIEAYIEGRLLKDERFMMPGCGGVRSGGHGRSGGGAGQAGAGGV